MVSVPFFVGTTELERDAGEQRCTQRVAATCGFGWVESQGAKHEPSGHLPAVIITKQSPVVGLVVIVHWVPIMMFVSIGFGHKGKRPA